MNKYIIGYESRDEHNLINRINYRIEKINNCINTLNQMNTYINNDMKNLRILRRQYE